MTELPILMDMPFYMLYGAVTMMCIAACCYLLLRRGNAFNPVVTPPVRLRRLTAVFFGAMAVSHMAYLPIYFLNKPDVMRNCLFMGALFDFMVVIPLAVFVLLNMLQDRCRPQWIIGVSVVPLGVATLWSLFTGNDAIVPAIFVYLTLFCTVVVCYLLLALLQYRRWLRDNYADLEHKEVWQTFVVMACIFSLLAYYVLGDKNLTYEYLVQTCEIPFICYLLWRVETLSDLSISRAQTFTDNSTTIKTQEEEDNSPSNNSDDYIEALLQQHCIDAQLYLQHDLSVSEMAKTIGVNRFYLSRYFSGLGTNYNTYINGLRIDHFIKLYKQAAATEQLPSAKQLAKDSGFRSYSTFSLAFKQRTGMSVTAWMRDFD